MKKQFAIFLLLLASLSSLTIHAQVNVEVKIDSVEMLVAEQTDITLKVTCEAKQQLTMPYIEEGAQLMPNIEVLHVYTPDTTMLNNGSHIEVSQRYTITAWDSTLYTIPPFVIQVDTSYYESNSLPLKVISLNVDTVNVDKFFGPKEMRHLPFSYPDWADLNFWSTYLIPCLGIGLLLLLVAANGKPIMRFVRRKKKLPPHKVAMNAITRIKNERTWAEEDSKEYYTQLTDTLRTYIQDRYGFSAMEMTSEQIIEHLLEVSDEQQLAELREIFRTADLVKFAKWNTPINENDANLVAAVEYINQTKQEEDPKAKPEPEVIREMDKERLKEVLIFRIASAVFIGGAIALAVWAVMNVYDIIR